ncbi:MAG: hypothetical protein VB106_09950 [Clostridiaceae bacterium]|nr:hypothetical protein [Clostridiaceae bacterium]
MSMNRFSNPELLNLPDCAGLSEKGKCMWLNIDVCKGDKCECKCSVKDYRLSQLKALQRLASLGDLQQAHIADKYYSGKKPWNKAYFRKIQKSGTIGEVEKGCIGLVI